MLHNWSSHLCCPFTFHLICLHKEIMVHKQENNLHTYAGQNLECMIWTSPMYTSTLFPSRVYSVQMKCRQSSWATEDDLVRHWALDHEATRTRHPKQNAWKLQNTRTKWCCIGWMTVRRESWNNLASSTIVTTVESKNSAQTWDLELKVPQKLQNIGSYWNCESVPIRLRDGQVHPFQMSW